MAALTDEQYRRALRANVDGVVFGVRELSARLMPNGGSIVATSSLAGLTATPMDPIYALTKHAVIGFVRSVAPQLAAKGIRINALCPGFTDTPIVEDEVRPLIDVPLMEPAFVADGGAAGAERRGDGRRVGRAAEPRRSASGSRTSRGRAEWPRSRRGWGGDLPAPHIWLTLGYRGDPRRAKASR